VGASGAKAAACVNPASTPSTFVQKESLHDLFRSAQPAGGGSVKCNSEAWSKFYNLFVIGYPSCCSKPVLVMIGAAIANIVNAFSQVLGTIPYSNLVAAVASSKFYKDGDTGDVVKWAVVICLFIVFQSLMGGLTVWLGEVLSLYWFRALVERAHSLYFRPGVLYATNKLVPNLDNADQRIATDTRLLSEQFGGLVFGSRTQSSIVVPIAQSVFGFALAL